MSDQDDSATSHAETDRVIIDLEEAERIASMLEMRYYETMENAYAHTEWEAARDAMMLRDRAGIEPNPDLLEDYDGEVSR